MPHHDVTVRNGDADDATGMQAIVWAFIRNPAAAVQIVLVVAGIVGVYYTLNAHIDEAKAAGEQHYKDLSSDIAHNYERLSVRIDQLLSDEKAEMDRIDTLYKRGDDRYTALQTKLSAHDVDIARIATGVDFIVQKFEDWSKDGGRQGLLLPRMPSPLGGQKSGAP